MKELRIKKFTVEEFKNKFNLDNIENISAYEISELGNLFLRIHLKRFIS